MDEKFKVRENGELFYICNSESKISDIIIPSEVDGIKVTSISEYAFQGSSLKNVIIPEGITSIGDYAFYSCKNLENVVIPDSVTEIGSHAFDGCDNLKSVRVSKNFKGIVEDRALDLNKEEVYSSYILSEQLNEIASSCSNSFSQLMEILNLEEYRDKELQDAIYSMYNVCSKLNKVLNRGENPYIIEKEYPLEDEEMEL